MIILGIFFFFFFIKKLLLVLINPCPAEPGYVLPLQTV